MMALSTVRFYSFTLNGICSTSGTLAVRRPPLPFLRLECKGLFVSQPLCSKKQTVAREVQAFFCMRLPHWTLPADLHSSEL